MRKSLAILFLCALGVYAADDPFIGTWKLNVAKSKFNPGPPPQAGTVIIAPDLVTVEETDASGKATKWSYKPGSPGVVMITDAPEGSSVFEVRKGNTVEHNWKLGNAIMTGKGVISKDGTAMRYTMQGTDQNGKKASSTEIYEKQ
jgi:hypothetical protein